MTNQGQYNTTQNLNQNNINNPQGQVNMHNQGQAGFNPNFAFQNKPKRPSVGELLTSYVRNWVNFKDRTSRYDYWMTNLLLLPITILYIIFLVSFLDDETVGPVLFLMGVILFLPFTIANLAISFRRAVDAGLNKRGYLTTILSSFIPFLGWASPIFNLVILCTRTNGFETNAVSGFSSFMFRTNPQAIAYYAQFNPYAVPNQGEAPQFNQAQAMPQQGYAHQQAQNVNAAQQVQEPVAPVQNVTPEPQVQEPVAPVQNVTPEPQVQEPVAPVQNVTLEPQVQEPVTPVQNVTPEPQVQEPVAPVQNVTPEPQVQEPVTPVQNVTSDLQQEQVNQVDLNKSSQVEAEEIIGYSPFGDPIVKKVDK